MNAGCLSTREEMGCPSLLGSDFPKHLVMDSEELSCLAFLLAHVPLRRKESDKTLKITVVSTAAKVGLVVGDKIRYLVGPCRFTVVTGNE